MRAQRLILRLIAPAFTARASDKTLLIELEPRSAALPAGVERQRCRGRPHVLRRRLIIGSVALGCRNGRIQPTIACRSFSSRRLRDTLKAIDPVRTNPSIPLPEIAIHREVDSLRNHEYTWQHTSFRGTRSPYIFNDFL